MSPGFGSNDRIDVLGAGQGVSNGAETLLVAGQCGLVAALAWLAGLLVFLLLNQEETADASGYVSGAACQFGDRDVQKR